MGAIEEQTGGSPEPVEEAVVAYRRVRELLFGGEQRQLSFLHHQFREIQEIQKKLHERCQTLQANEVDLARRLRTIAQRGDEFVDQNLAAAIHRRISGSEASRDELVEALKEPVEESLRRSISEDPDRLGNALEPAVSPGVSRGWREIFRESGLQKLVRFRPDGSARLAWPVAILISLVLAGLTGWLVLSIKGNLALQRAAAALRTEPGIVVAASENPFFGKPRISGLRDPLAPEAVKILETAGLDAREFVIDLQPFQSINTSYAHQREQDRVRDLEEMRRQMIDAIGELTSANETVRERDLEVFTRALFAVRFPEAAGKVQLTSESGEWRLSGTIGEPVYSQMVEQSADLVLTGKVDVSGLKNATALGLTTLRGEIEIIRLTFLPGKPEFAEDGVRQGQRLVELIRHFDAETAKMGRLPVSFAVRVGPAAGELNQALEAGRIGATEKLLMEGAGIPVERILPGVRDTREPPGPAGISVKVIDPEN